MANDKIIQEQDTQHLQGGQESPDMAAFRERFYTDKAWLNRDAINAIGAIAGNMLLLFDTFTETQETLNEIKTTLKSIDEKAAALTNELSTTRSMDGSIANNIDSIADAVLRSINGDMNFHVATPEGITVHNDEFTRIADTLEAEANSVDSISTEMSAVVSHERGFDSALRIEGDRIYNTPCC